MATIELTKENIINKNIDINKNIIKQPIRILGLL